MSFTSLDRYLGRVATQAHIPRHDQDDFKQAVYFELLSTGEPSLLSGLDASVKKCHDRELTLAIARVRKRFQRRKSLDPLPVAVPINPPDSQLAELIDELRPRERTVIQLTLQGYTPEQIGAAFGMSARTVSYTRANAIAELRLLANAS